MLKRDAIEILKGIQDNLEETRFLERCAIDMGIEALKQRPRGEWLRGSLWSEGCGMGEQYGYYYICSVCGHEFKGGYTKCNVQYCAKCGSDNLPGEGDEK